MSNPSTLITRFYGLYSIKPYKNNAQTVRFIVMNNVFDTPFKIDKRFDLKGSTVGREADEKELARETPIFKDLDILKQKRKIVVGKAQKSKILAQLKSDVDWLSRNGIMDYSLLLGVHNCDKKDEFDIMEDGLQAYAKMILDNDTVVEETKQQEREYSNSNGNFDLREAIKKKSTEPQLPSPRSQEWGILKKDSKGETTSFKKRSTLDSSVHDIKEEKKEDLVVTELGESLDVLPEFLQKEGITHKLSGYKKKDGHKVKIELPVLTIENHDREITTPRVTETGDIDEIDTSSSDDALTLSPRPSNTPPDRKLTGKFDAKNPVRNSMLSIFNPLSNRLSTMFDTKKEEMIILKNIGPNRVSDFQKAHGGMLSLPNKTDGQREIYYVGIIDLLQKWNDKKKLESFFKGFQHDKTLISSVDPKTYAKRFFDFVEKLLE